MNESILNVIWHYDNSNRGGVKPREYEWICSLLPDIPTHHHFDQNIQIQRDHALHILEGYEYSNDQINTLIDAYNNRSTPFGIIHIGDEHPSTDLRFYKQADFVFRNYWKPEIDQYDHCHYLPLGPNCSLDVLRDGTPRKQRRRYAWSFAGHVRPGPRKALFDAVLTRDDGRLFATNYFNTGLPEPAYAQLLRDSRIVLCPRGFAFEESYRVYEALEAGAIPIVEDRGGIDLLREHAQWSTATNALCGGPRYWYDAARRAVNADSYWLRAYDDAFPCPRIYRWENLPQILDRIDTETLPQRVRNWWTSYKTSIRERISSHVSTHLF